MGTATYGEDTEPCGFKIQTYHRGPCPLYDPNCTISPACLPSRSSVPSVAQPSRNLSPVAAKAQSETAVARGLIAKMLDRIVLLVKTQKNGLRAEEIRSKLGMQAKEMPRILKEGISTKKLTSKGHKRATTYAAR